MIDLLFIYFRTLTLDHLDAAWYCISKQDFTGIRSVTVLDNNTLDSPQAIVAVLDRYPVPVPLRFCFAKHGLSNRTQSWSVNRAVQLAMTEWFLLTRADFLLDYDFFARILAERASRPAHWRGFVTSWCQQMGYDAGLSNTDALAPHSERSAPWRTDPLGPKTLVGQVPSHYFQSTGLDAGVWLTRKSLVAEAGGLNERMVSWGFQQQEFQRRLSARGVEMVVIPEYLFHHQHHWAPRDFAMAGKETAFDRGSA